MKTQFAFVLIFAAAAVGLVLTVLGISRLLRKDKPNDEKNASYESGEQTEGSSQVAFNIKFYVIAVIFLIFELEMVLLFPWVQVYTDKQMIAKFGLNWVLINGLEILIFVFLLALGLAYVWKKGLIDWLVVPTTKAEKRKWPVKLKDYQALNDKY